MPKNLDRPELSLLQVTHLICFLRVCQGSGVSGKNTPTGRRQHRPRNFKCPKTGLKLITEMHTEGSHWPVTIHIRPWQQNCDNASMARQVILHSLHLNKKRCPSVSLEKRLVALSREYDTPDAIIIFVPFWKGNYSCYSTLPAHPDQIWKWNPKFHQTSGSIFVHKVKSN